MGIENFQEKLARLNTSQREAVESLDGPLLVVAGPGSGKTEILGLRVANILLKTDTPSHSILCLSFTESAALTMRQRLLQLIGPDAHKITVHTFHSFCLELINRYPHYFFQGTSFRAADQAEKTELLQELLDQLPASNPLAKQHPQSGYIYLQTILSSIQDLKKAGLTPEDFQIILEENASELPTINQVLEEVMSQTVSKKQFPAVGQIVQKLRKGKGEIRPKGWISPMASWVADSLERALRESEKISSSVPLSVWKRRWMDLDSEKKRVFKDSRYGAHLFSLAEIYAQYQKKLYENGLLDFDDMLIEVIKALDSEESFRLQVQEEYLYILVDEFQDTNQAQMRILTLLTDAEIHEGRPNFMVVGDDDQGIFKFQGASLSNIREFTTGYIQPKIVTLKENYRSTQAILDLASDIIRRGEDRLENSDLQIKKELQSANSSLTSGKIERYTFNTKEEEFYWVGSEISRLLENGEKASEIAVIGRRHRQLENLIPYFHYLQIPVRYDHELNVLTEPHIRQLIQLARLIDCLSQKLYPEVDVLLPEILSYPFWAFDRQTVWKLSLQAYQEHRLWLDCMMESPNHAIQKVALFLQDLSARARVEPAENILASLIGEESFLLAENEDEESEKKNSVPTSFSSPFKQFYFSPEKFQRKRGEYLLFLSSLKVFIQALREYRQGKNLQISDLVHYVDIHQANNLELLNHSPFVSDKETVTLLTAHKAKGMEFRNVFVICCQDDIWAEKGYAEKLPFPINLPITPPGENLDDHLRLFYVAITRTKQNLYLTSHRYDQRGKESLPLHFLPETIPPRLVEEERSTISEILVTPFLTSQIKPFVKDEQALLLPVIESYLLSVTHLHNFLNVRDGGPSAFLERNLLRFPQPKTASLVFGSVIHEVIHRIYSAVQKTDSLPSLDEVLSWFEETMRRQRISSNEMRRAIERGRQALTGFYQLKSTSFLPSHEVERDFRHQGVVIGEARLSGKIDKLIKEDKTTISVWDYKTGKALSGWLGKSADEKIKAWKYRQQLIFYKLLIENSRDYGRQYRVKRGVLEFVEPLDGKWLELSLEIDEEETKRLKKLIEVVFQKIMRLDFPTTSHYPADLKGIQMFEEDLLNAKI